MKGHFSCIWMDGFYWDSSNTQGLDSSLRTFTFMGSSALRSNCLLITLPVLPLHSMWVTALITISIDCAPITALINYSVFLCLCSVFFFVFRCYILARGNHCWFCCRCPTAIYLKKCWVLGYCRCPTAIHFSKKRKPLLASCTDYLVWICALVDGVERKRKWLGWSWGWSHRFSSWLYLS